MLSPLSPKIKRLNHCQCKHGRKQKSPLPKVSPTEHQALKILQEKGLRGQTG